MIKISKSPLKCCGRAGNESLLSMENAKLLARKRQLATALTEQNLLD
jgi:hypothetical protein